MNRYLESLPRGVASYPDCKTKASLLRAHLDSVDTAAVLDALPVAVASLVTTPPPASSWIPSVHLLTFLLAVRETLYQDDAEFGSWCLDVRRRLLATRMYRILFAVASPSAVVKGAARRWSHIVQGPELHAEDVRSDSASLRLTHPAHLYTPTVLLSVSTSFTAAVEMAGARNVKNEVRDVGPVGCRFEVRWS